MKGYLFIALTVLCLGYAVAQNYQLKCHVCTSPPNSDCEKGGSLPSSYLQSCKDLNYVPVSGAQSALSTIQYQVSADKTGSDGGSSLNYTLLPGQEFLCMKLVVDTSGVKTMGRGCAVVQQSANMNGKCEGPDKNNKVCFCNKDGCNGASSLTVSAVSVISLLAIIYNMYKN